MACHCRTFGRPLHTDGASGAIVTAGDQYAALVRARFVCQFQARHATPTTVEPTGRPVGLPNLRSYDLRHMFCSFALMNGIDKDVIRQWMGHKSFQMIDQVYTHFLDDYRK